MMRVKFKVMGMHCSSCSAFVERSVSAMEGVEKCSVNLLQESMLVDYDENKVTNEAIIDVVIDGGFEAEVIVKNEIRKEDTSLLLLKKKKKSVIVSFILLIPLMYLSMGHMIGLSAPSILEGNANMVLMAFFQAIFTIIIMLIHNHYFINGFKMLFKGAPSMDSLIALGSSAAFIYSSYLLLMMFTHVNDASIVHANAHNLYFESAAMILTLISLGKYLEERSKKKTSEAVSKLMDLSAKSAIVIRDEVEVEIETEDILVGDLIVIKPGMNIPVDGEIVEGSSSLDESSISGESRLLEKGVGDKVISGTFNTNGSFIMKAEKVGDETTLAQIIQLVEDANSSKPQIAKLADKVSGIFVPVVISIAIICFIIWMLIEKNFGFALSIAISVLVISCPCALGLATPTAIMVGSGKAAENGMLLKRSESLEVLHETQCVLLDKTGTITYGSPSVSSISTKMDKDAFMAIASGIEMGSEHPLSKAILEYVKENNIEPAKTINFEAFGGKGAKAEIGGILYYAGNIKLMKENNIDLLNYETISSSYAHKGEIPIYVASEKEVLGVISLSDQIKPTSKKAISEMKKLGLKVFMVTGDNKITAQHIQKDLDLDGVYAEVLPQDKESIVRDMQNKGYKVIMVGDGINDAPALSRADVGVAIGAGSDIALESADIVLIKNDLLDVLGAIKLSHAVIKNIKQNLFWAFFYNSIGIPLAAGLFYLPFGILLNPMFGAAAMSLSSICVVTNALRLRKINLH